MLANANNKKNAQVKTRETRFRSTSHDDQIVDSHFEFPARLRTARQS